MNNYEEYLELDLIDIFKTIKSKWKTIVVFILIFTVLVGAFGVYTSNKPKASTEARIKSVKARLTDEEASNVEDAAKIIEEYRVAYAEQKDYLKNSIKHNVDPYAIKTITLTYYVDNHFSVTYPVIADNDTLVPMIHAYTARLSNDQIYVDLSKQIGVNIKPTYYKEIVTAGTSDEAVGIFTVKIFANTDELLTEISEYIKDVIEDTKPSVVESYGDHDISLVSEVKAVRIDTDVATSQQEDIKTLTTISEEITEIEEMYTGNQLSYLELLIHEELEEKTNVKMYFVVGFILGAVLGTVWIVIRYITSGTVKTEKELATILGVESFGKVDKDKAFVGAKINNAIKKNGASKVVLVTNNEEKLSDFESLVEGVTVIVDPLNEKSAFEKLTSNEFAILVVGLKSTKYEELFSLKKMCDDSSIKILGSVLK